ncbi:MAG TPA: nucleotide-binding domain containing protein, partial [Symbiobacteriaceae bacterium]|nr:nucleotide-binding domain containing protein [Symbiobacteriaceae bacterium]
EGVVKAGAGSRLIVVGTDTGEAVCRQLQITERAVTREVAPGLPVLRAESGLVRGPAVAGTPLLLVLKPGSHGEPDTLLQVVSNLATLELA